VHTVRGALSALVVGLVALSVGMSVGCSDGSSVSEEHASPQPAKQPTRLAAAPAAKAAGQTPVLTVPDFVELAKRLSPVVVNISTRAQPHAQPQSRRQAPERRFGPGQPGWPFGGEGGDPKEFWEPFERFFGPMPRQRRFRQRSLGSGFILGADGTIVTNNHVIEGADEVLVKLSNDVEYEATVVGKDAKTDVAVLRIDGAEDLAVATLGDSDVLEVGEWVLAIGNPFGLDHTVTAGIVSAKGRFIGAGNYDDYIQTDAAINPGNSGGPMLNLRGEVVGINSAIFSRTGGNIGIGFAIPINLAKDLIPQLQEHGRVTRGWLGVLIQRVTADIAESLGLEEARGALVADVVEDGPAEAAGLQVGDVIIEFDGQRVEESNDLPLMVARTPVGSEVILQVLRDQETEEIEVTIAELADDEVEVAGAGEGEEFGLTVQTLTPEIAENLGVDEEAGVVVTAVDSGSPSEEAGLRRGDIILEVNRQSIDDVDEYLEAVEGRGKGKNVLFLVRRGDNTIFLALKPES